MSTPSRTPDMARAIAALLATPQAGQAVARALETQAEDRQTRAVIGDLRARRAQRVYDLEADAAEAERLGPTGASPWSRAG